MNLSDVVNVMGASVRKAQFLVAVHAQLDEVGTMSGDLAAEDFNKIGTNTIKIKGRDTVGNMSNEVMVELVIKSIDLEAKKKIFVNGYWETYGLVLNAHVDLANAELSDEKITNKRFVVLQNGIEVGSSDVVLTDWYTDGKLNSYQSIISNGLLEDVTVGNYMLALEYKVADQKISIPLSITSNATTHTVNEKTNFSKLGNHVLGTETVHTKVENNLAVVEIRKVVTPYIYKLCCYMSDGNIVFDGYLAHTDFDFVQEHTKILVVRNAKGEVVKTVNPLTTWNIANWKLEYQYGHDLSGFQALITPDIAGDGYSYAIQVVQDSSIVIEVTLNLDNY